ncbi:MAG: high-affinity branched-chain amino acid ABC transporter permease LivM [Bosea sp.]|jgi:branched-chain amino acid transport system permease protein|nr:high-affinity branched-chain amino acid ABC transporter permease LivM [Bosea sp. (in: a-proteobacteria)]
MAKAGGQLVDQGKPVKTGLAPALKEAAFAGLITFGLCIPIIAYGTRQDLNNRLILDARWDAVAWAVAIVFIGRLLVTLNTQRRAAGGAAIMRVPQAVKPFLARLSPVLAPIAIGFLFAFPVISIMLSGWQGSTKWIDNFGVQILIYVMLGWGLNIVVGLAGLLDLGYVAFYAVGAYSYALFATSVIPATYPALGVWAFWICLPVAGILAAFWGILLGFPVLRLRGDYLAIVTLAFGEMIRLVLINWVDFSGGYAGISGIPRPSFFGIPFNASDKGFAATFGLEFTPLYRTIFLYYVILVLALLTAFVTIRLRRMPVGRAWEALREDEIACRSLGINTTTTKLTAFSLGAGFGGIAGAFFAAKQGFISPESFTFMESAVILAIVVLGGMGSLWGVAIAAAVMTGGPELMREMEFTKQIFGPEFDPTQYRMLLFGLAMVVIMIWKPRGLISTREPTAFLKQSKAVSGSHVKEGHG